MYISTRDHKATCIYIHVANCQPRVYKHTWLIVQLATLGSNTHQTRGHLHVSNCSPSVQCPYTWRNASGKLQKFCSGTSLLYNKLILHATYQAYFFRIINSPNISESRRIFN